MAKHIKNENAEAVVEAVSKTEQFFNKNGKKLGILTVLVIVLAAGIFLWSKFIDAPQKEEAKGAMAYAEEAFRNFDYETALNGNAEFAGFAEIIDTYGSKAGESVYFYAGICALNLNDWESAIEYLKQYNGDDAILSARAKACLGDAYTGLEDYSAALGCFEDAANVIDNIYAADYLLKAGATAEKLGQNDKALGYYLIIKDKYQQSFVGYDIDKYIGRLQK